MHSKKEHTWLLHETKISQVSLCFGFSPAKVEDFAVLLSLKTNMFLMQTQRKAHDRLIIELLTEVRL